MENKKLLKFLYKDIAEIEELFVEKGSEGFDEYEIEFIQSRFKGAKQIVQILSEKENGQLTKITPPPVVKDEERYLSESHFIKKENITYKQKLSDNVEESLASLTEFEKELKGNDRPQSLSAVESEVGEVEEEKESIQSQVVVDNEIEKTEEEPDSANEAHVSETPKQKSGIESRVRSSENPEPSIELNDETEVNTANHRLGDSFMKEKSVNELLAGDSNKLEHKISNSRVASIKASIGINDRYQYIRELFDGNADTFSKAVGELDSLTSIKEAVTYLQQNYKWKKNETSLKFVNLVKRRFSNE